MDQLQKSIIAKNRGKLINIDKFFEAVRFRENQSQEQTISILRALNNRKKHIFKKFEENHPNWRTESEELIKEIYEQKNKLLLIETELMEDIENALKKFNDMQDQLKREIEDITRPNFGKIQELIREFQSKVSEHCKNEFERFTAAL